MNTNLLSPTVEYGSAPIEQNNTQLSKFWKNVDLYHDKWK